MYPFPTQKSNGKERSAFTLIELLVVIAIIAILAIVVVLTLNPAELLKQSRDSNRMSDTQTITSALNLYNEDQGGTSGYSLGTPGTIYLSVPDPTATSSAGNNCSGLGLPVSSTTYHCAASSTYRKTNGTGWIPINLASTTIGSPLSSLPVDPINTTSSGEYYKYSTDGNNFEIAGIPESQKYSSAPTTFAAGSSRTLIALGSSLASQAAVPTFSPVAGSYSYNSCYPLSVTISSVTAGATICYTTDGSTPTANGAGSCTHGVSSSSVALTYTGSTTVNSIASENGYTDSVVGSATYTSTRGPCY